MLDGCDVTASCLLITVGNIFKIKGLSVSAATVCLFFLQAEAEMLVCFPHFHLI